LHFIKGSMPQENTGVSHWISARTADKYRRFDRGESMLIWGLPQRANVN
jgi:hypothetical protein